MVELNKQQTHIKLTLTNRSLSRFLLFSMVVLAFFSILNYSQGLEILALVQALVLATLPFAYSWLKRGAPHATIKHLIGFDALVIFVPLIFVPTIDNTGIYWIFSYPMIVFFFLGIRTGFQWIFAYIIILLAGLYLASKGVLSLYHSPMQITLAFVEIIVFTAIGYFFVSDRENAERQQMHHLYHLESLERIERALHADLNLERSMDRALQSLLDIFSCSRAWMLFPARADTPFYRVKFEKHLPEYPGALAADIDIKTDDESYRIFAEAAESKYPVCYGPTRPLPEGWEVAEKFSIRSQMNTLLNRETHTPWMLGMHQCDYEREWSAEEQRLFHDIAMRVEDALNQMLLYQELATSELNLRKAIRQAEAASHAKSEFLSVMSHELRTPLHGIIGLQNLIASDTEALNNEQRENLSLAQQAAKSLRALVNDVLDLAKIESGNMELIQEEFNLFDCVRDAVIPFVVTAKYKGVSIDLNLEMVPEIIIGDESRLRQVLLNLIGNAIKFTDEGSISVEVSKVEGKLSFIVKDSGIGIPKEHLDDIFEPFTQVMLSNRSRPRGTGLGTNIIKRFVELMGGEISVHSEVGKGTCFTFTIPCHTNSNNTVTHKLDATRMNLNVEPDDSFATQTLDGLRPFRIRALLAEDDPIGQRIVVKQLARAGIDVVSVDNGNHAWKKIRNEHFDMLLTDIRMPGLSGIELTRKIRQLEEETSQERLPIVGLSAHAMEDVANECIDAGMDHFMTKPVDPESILAAVTRNSQSKKRT